MDIANIIIAVIVPFVSVFVAQQMTRAYARRTQAMDVFLKTNRDLLNYKYTAMAYRSQRYWAEEHPRESQKARDAMPETQRKLLDAATELEDDCFALGLLFDKKADDIGSRIRRLAGDASNRLMHGALIAEEELHVALDAALVDIKPRLGKLWKQLAAQDPANWEGAE